MKKFLLALALLTMCGPAYADGRFNKDVRELNSTTDEIGSNDINIWYQQSTDAYPRKSTTWSQDAAVNPWLRGGVFSFTSAQLGAGATLFNSVPGKKIYLPRFQMYANIATAGATSITIECAGSQNDLVAAPVAMLVSGVTIGEQTSAPSATAQASYFTPDTLIGCPIGEGVTIRSVGSAITGSTAFKVFAQPIVK